MNTVRWLIVCAAACLLLSCSKKEAPAPPANADTNVAAANSGNQPPAQRAMQTPATPEKIGNSTNMDATLAELTRELHRTMMGRKLSGSFEEFVKIRNLQVPPPPPGKKYAITKQWRVVLVDAK